MSQVPVKLNIRSVRGRSWKAMINDYWKNRVDKTLHHCAKGPVTVGQNRPLAVFLLISSRKHSFQFLHTIDVY